MVRLVLQEVVADPAIAAASRRCAAGLGVDLNRERMEELGFYVCDDDLADELIRPLGAATVEEVLGRNGDLASFVLQRVAEPPLLAGVA